MLREKERHARISAFSKVVRPLNFLLFLISRQSRVRSVGAHNHLDIIRIASRMIGALRGDEVSYYIDTFELNECDTKILISLYARFPIPVVGVEEM